MSSLENSKTFSMICIQQLVKLDYRFVSTEAKYHELPSLTFFDTFRLSLKFSQ